MTATREQEATLPGERLLAMGEREIGKGNLREGAGLVWQAVMEALAATAKHHGMPCRNREEARLFAKHLDLVRPIRLLRSDDPGSIGGITPPADEHIVMRSEPDTAEYWHQLRFDLADSFREHNEDLEDFSDTEFEWEPDEYAVFLEPVRSFIVSLNRRRDRGTES